MMTIWDVLGIQPTKDEREIRRAYARELKLRRPSQDPQGFQELREAFDSAKRYASSEEPIILYQESELTPQAEETPPMPPESLAVSDISWSQNTLWPKAHSLSILLIKDELKGLDELHQYLDNEMPDALDARQAFSLMLARELSEQPGLYRSLLNQVSAVMSWQLDSIHSPQLSHWTLLALEEQITLTEQENYWQELARKYTGSRLKQLKWRLLTEKGTPVPWWGRLLPDFQLQLTEQVREIRQLHPALQERLNPLLLDEHYQSQKAVNWEVIITILFWGYTAWVINPLSTQMALSSGVMLVIVASFLWVYPALKRGFKTEAAKKGIHAFFWLASVLLLATAYYGIWQIIITLKNKGSSSEQTAAIFTILAVMLCLIPWIRRREWRTLPIIVVVEALRLPALFIRKLPPVINLIGLVILSLLFSFYIKIAFGIK